MDDVESSTGIKNGDSDIWHDSVRRPLVVSVKDRTVTVNSLKIAMSRRHKAMMLLDLYTLSFVSAMSVYVLMMKSWSAISMSFIVFACLASWTCALGKTICDFSNWLFTMNIMNENMARWAVEDVVGICQDFVTAGTKLVCSEVRNVSEGQKS